MRSFDYTRPRSLSEAIQAVVAAGDGARYLAGGTTLYDLMKLGIEEPTTVVDVARLPELSSIDVTEEGVRFGALVRMSDAAEHQAIKLEYPMISEALWLAASQQLRNMATLGGNLLQRTRCPYFRGGEPYACNKRVPGSGCSAIGGLDRGLAVLGGSLHCIANYPGDLAVALVALDTQLDIVGPSGARTIALEQLYREPGATPHIETTLKQGEFIKVIRVPASKAARASTYLKIRDRESYAFALASAAVGLATDGDIVREARIALGGVASRPWRVRDAEKMLIGRTFTSALAREAGRTALADARPGRTNGFRIELAARAVADALMIARERA
jgi:xanthine dehydrogenase YagS FAD-binding subunit